ncbi:hypothetical protein ES288_A02G160900v1 [Gossypium darwinii]|uniref:Uncharacterized protein n=2 Tax=Gossypium TaxID=3633 RepID=A0A5D2RKT3_GOSTO|nr:hypothetical protein ES288_A02G160900v1 [Gossypium darwinii]TYI40420.1 hypothetical protein ES332_A02G161000v1 [Gossypium tomentosum]
MDLGPMLLNFLFICPVPLITPTVSLFIIKIFTLTSHLIATLVNSLRLPPVLSWPFSAVDIPGLYS